MKKVIPTFMVIFCAMVTSGCSQSLFVKKQIAVPTIQCNGCVKRIENAVGQISGVKEATVDLDQKVVSVAFDPYKTNLKSIEESIANVGYHANDTPRNPEAYAKLPMCCKEPKDRPKDQQQTIAGRWEERDKWQKVPAIFQAMGIKEGSWVADVGAGFGYLTLKLAEVVGAQGKVLAVDIEEGRLNRIRARLEKDHVENVTLVHGEIDDPLLPTNSLDAAVIVDAYHEMSEYKSMLHHLLASLKPGGRLVLVEPISKKNRQKSRKEQVGHHEIAIRFVRAELKDAGFEIMEAREPFATHPFHEEQWLLVGRRPKTNK